MAAWYNHFLLPELKIIINVTFIPMKQLIAHKTDIWLEAIKSDKQG